MREPKDYYAILSIDPSADLKQIKTAYRQLALKYHPDHNPNNKEAEQIFSLVKEAYEVLSDPNERKNYDSTYRPIRTPSSVQTAQPDIEKNAPKSGDKTKKAAPNLRYTIYLTLEEVSRGTQKTIRYIRKGLKEKETVEVTVPIPRGAYPSQRLKLAGYGDYSGTNYSDLYVIIQYHNHPMFIRTDLDLRINVPVTYLDVLLGQSIEVPTLHGLKKIKLVSCGFDQLKITLQGMGLPNNKSTLTGDLHIHCFVENPKKLTAQDKARLQQLGTTWPQGELMQQYQTDLNSYRRG